MGKDAFSVYQYRWTHKHNRIRDCKVSRTRWLRGAGRAQEWGLSCLGGVITVLRSQSFDYFIRYEYGFYEQGAYRKSPLTDSRILFPRLPEDKQNGIMVGPLETSLH
jgi:hypothetical protein